MGIFDWFKNKKQTKLESKCPQHLIDVGYNTELLLKVLKRRKEVEIGESLFDPLKDVEETQWFTETLKKGGFDLNFSKDSVIEKKLMTLFFQFDPMYIDETIKELSLSHKLWKGTIYQLHKGLDLKKVKIEEFTVDYPTMDDLLSKTYHTTT